MAKEKYFKRASIYIITNLINGKRYVGQTVKSVRRRWQLHYNAAERNTRRECTLFYRAIRKYGRSNFSVASATIFNCPATLLDVLERDLILSLDTVVPNGYNLQLGGLSNRTVHPTTKAKLSTNKKGYKHSAEARAKMSLSARGKPKTAAHRANIAAAKRGKPRPRWIIDKMNAACRGKPLSDNTKAKISASLQGHPHSAETRAKIAAAGRRRGTAHMRTPAARAKQLESRKRHFERRKGDSCDG